MRSAGVTHARIGELELHLGPPPLPARVAPGPPADAPEDEERTSLETLLHSSGADVGPLLSAFRRVREKAA
jgi:hypothetical protein